MDDERDKKREERRRASEEKKAAQSKLRGRLDCEENNPCFKEHHLSSKCMQDNNFNEERCRLEFENYKSCKRFWSQVQLDRRRKGIVPELPSAAEREKIKAEFFKKIRGD